MYSQTCLIQPWLIRLNGKPTENGLEQIFSHRNNVKIPGKYAPGHSASWDQVCLYYNMGDHLGNFSTESV